LSRLKRVSCRRPEIRLLRSSWRGRHSRICASSKASALAYFDVFWLLAAVMLVLVPVVLLMKRSVAEKGARVGVE
jgi:hypothetical protein